MMLLVLLQLVYNGMKDHNLKQYMKTAEDTKIAAGVQEERISSSLEGWDWENPENMMWVVALKFVKYSHGERWGRTVEIEHS